MSLVSVHHQNKTQIPQKTDPNKLEIGLKQILENPLATVQTQYDPYPIVLIDVKLVRIIHMQKSLQGKFKSAFHLGDAFVKLCERVLSEGNPLQKTMAILIFYCFLPGHEDTTNQILIESRPSERDIVFEKAFIKRVAQRLSIYIDGMKPNYQTVPLSFRPFVVDKVDKNKVPQIPESDESLLENTYIGVAIWAQNEYRRRIPNALIDEYLQQ